MPENIALQLLKLHEGYRQKPYHCTAGKLTVGYGRNLDDVGLSVEESEYLLKNDINRAVMSLQAFPFWVKLSEARRAVLIDMHVNMGNSGLMKFRKMLDALTRHDYAAAASEMQKSLWYKQVPNRAAELMKIMRTGEVE